MVHFRLNMNLILLRAMRFTAFVFLGLFVLTSFASETLDVPPGYDTTSGGSTSTLFHNIRIQNCYAKHLFPAKPLYIEGIHMRPAQLNGFAFSNRIRLEIRLSTTKSSPEALNPRFSENAGLDEALVAEGEMDLSSQNLRDSNGIAVYDIKILFNKPFFYDPSNGNLLVEVRNFTGGGSHIDGIGSFDDGGGRAFALGADSETATGVDHGVDLVKFVVREVSVQTLSESFTNTNPSGPWSFGWKSNLVQDFNRLPNFKVASAENGVPIQIWSSSPALLPAVFHNGTGLTATSDGIEGVFPPGSTWFYAGVENSEENYCVIRFTASNKGFYELKSGVRPFLNGSKSGDTDFHVFAGSTPVFEKFLGATEVAHVDRVIFLNSGETADFMIGRGRDGILFGSGLKIDASLKQVSILSNIDLTITPADSFFTNSIQVDIQSTIPNVEIRFTLDGSEPTASSPVFDQKIVLDSNREIRARAFAGLNPISSIVSRTFMRYAQQFDLSDGFSSVNPSGPWSYGWKQALSGVFTLLPNFKVAFSDNGVPIQIWSLTPSSSSAVFHNDSQQTAFSDGGSGIFPPDSTWFYAGIDGAPDNFSVIRFTAPEEGTYEMRFKVQPYLNGSIAGDTDFHVHVGNQPLFESFLNPHQGAASTNVFFLSAGSFVDFAIGRGRDGRLFASGLKIEAQLSLLNDCPATNSLKIKFSGATQLFTNTARVTISTDSTLVIIRYTLDGSEPTIQSTVYGGPISINQHTTVRARAYLGECPASFVSGRLYQRAYAIDDGIPASWRELYFGVGYVTDPRVHGAADPDNDGQNNFREFLAGTDPTNPDSVFKVVSIHLSPVISWNSLSNRNYQVEKKTFSVTNSVLTTNWFPIGSLITATSSITSFVDITTTNSDLSIYRVQLVP